MDMGWMGMPLPASQNWSLPTLYYSERLSPQDFLLILTDSTTLCHAPLPVVKDKAAGHSTQKQDYGQVELELLILVLVCKPATTDIPGKVSYWYPPALTHQPPALPPLPIACPSIYSGT